MPGIVFGLGMDTVDDADDLTVTMNPVITGTFARHCVVNHGERVISITHEHCF